MKKVINISFVLILCLLYSCNKFDDPYKPVPSPFSVNCSNTTVPAEGATVRFLISAGSNGWWVTMPTESETWISCPRLFGGGDYDLPIVIKANQTGSPRSVKITINPTFNLDPVVITLNQL